MKWSDATRATLLAEFGAGSTVEKACAKAGVSVRTYRTWLRKGVHEPDGEFAAFRVAVEEVRGQASDAVLTEEDVLRELSRMARKGSISAMKELLAHYRREREAVPKKGRGKSDDEDDDEWAGEF